MMRPALAAMAVLVLVPRFRLVTEFHLCLGYAPAYRWPPSLSVAHTPGTCWGRPRSSRASARPEPSFVQPSAGKTCTIWSG